MFFFFFFFNDTATTEIYTLSLHDALPILARMKRNEEIRMAPTVQHPPPSSNSKPVRSEEHTSELQSRSDLVCRLLLEKKKKKTHKEVEDINAHTHDEPTLLHTSERVSRAT